MDLSIACTSPTTVTHDSATAATSASTATAATSASTATSETSSLNLGWVDWTADFSTFGLGLGMGGGLDLPLLPQDSNMKEAKILPSTEPMILAGYGGRDATITDDMRADLDQIFIERVHPVLPFIYWRSYLSWEDQKNPGTARACLRSAMRTMAAAMSAPNTRFCDQLYAETCHLLQAFTVGSKDNIPIEYIQAWLLLGHFELLRVGEHQAMLTAGRCCRLALMARLFDIDVPGSKRRNSQQVSLVGMINEDAHVPGFEETFSDVEERRRTFWVAFCLDRLLCSRNEYPLTLQEEMASATIGAQTYGRH